MPDLRQHQRITDTQDLVAGLQSIGRPLKAGRVLNLSQGGMLVTGTTLPVGEITGFELAGPGFRCAGTAKVAHTTDGATGLQFICWRGEADRSVRALVVRRTHNTVAASIQRSRRFHSAPRTEPARRPPQGGIHRKPTAHLTSLQLRRPGPWTHRVCYCRPPITPAAA